MKSQPKILIVDDDADFVELAKMVLTTKPYQVITAYSGEEGLQKISEYMYFQKPIVACGIAESKEYLLVDKEDMAKNILKALNGNVHPSRRKTWENYCEKKIFKMFHLIQSEKFF